METLASTVFGFAENEAQAARIVDQLRGAAFPDAAISVLAPAPAQVADALDDGTSTKAPEGAVAGVGTGGLIGGALGWLTGVGALAIPGLGPFIAAGPLLAVLTGAAVGATVGGVAGGLVGLGLTDRDTERYEAELRAGRILVSVRATTPSGVDAAQRIFAANGAHEVSATGAVDRPVDSM